MRLTKIQNVGIYILRRYGKEAGTIELNKLFYLSDVAYYRLFGESLSGVHYIRADYGPYSKEIADELCALEKQGIKRDEKPGRSPYPKIAWSIKPNAKMTPSLRQEEKEVIDHVLDFVRGLTPLEIEALSYKTEPMLAIVEQENKYKCQLLLTGLNFDEIQRDVVMMKFLESKKRPPSENDKEYHNFLQTELSELDAILQ